MEWTQGYVESGAPLRRASQEIVGITLAEVGQPVTVQHLELLRRGVEAQLLWALSEDQELIARPAQSADCRAPPSGIEGAREVSNLKTAVFRSPLDLPGA